MITEIIVAGFQAVIDPLPAFSGLKWAHDCCRDHQLAQKLQAEPSFVVRLAPAVGKRRIEIGL
jgi:hypothetical protein